MSKEENNDTKVITMAELEEIARKVGFPEYPQYIGNGLYKLADNCITGRRGFYHFMEALGERLHINYDWYDDLKCNMFTDIESNLKKGFEQIFKKPFDMNQVYKRRMQHFVRNTDNTEWFCYCNRCFLIIHRRIDFDKNCYVLDYEIPPKLYYKKERNKIEFIDKAQ